MKRFVVDIIILLFISLIIYLAISYSYQKKFSIVETENANVQKQLTGKKQPFFTLADISFVINKYKELISIKNGLLYFSARSEKLARNQWKITIELNGKDGSAGHAADLRLDFPENFTISNLRVGPAFPTFPRQVNAANYLLITGLSSTNNNQIIFGKPNKIFAEFTVQTTDSQTNKKQISINQDETKIYLDGESVLDTKTSVKLIDLP